VTEREDLDEGLEALGLELRRLPTSMPPAALVARVRRLAHAELAERADERRDRPVLVFLLLFAWAVSLFALLAARVLSGQGHLGIATGATFSWSAAWFGYSWISSAAVLVLLGVHLRKQRRLA
jgi:hypothetical protein